MKNRISFAIACAAMLLLCCSCVPMAFAGETGSRSANTTWVSNYVNGVVSGESPQLSNAVMQVGVGLDEQTVDALNEMADGKGGFPLPSGQTATTIGSLLLAIVASVAWLRTKIRQKADSSTNAPEYSPGSTYSSGEYASHEGGLFKCAVDGATGAWDASKWVPVSFSDPEYQIGIDDADGMAAIQDRDGVKVWDERDRLPYDLVELSGSKCQNRAVNYVTTTGNLSSLHEPAMETRKNPDGTSVTLCRDFVLDVSNMGEQDITIDFANYVADPQKLNLISDLDVAQALSVSAGHRAWIFFSECAPTNGVATLVVMKKDFGEIQYPVPA